MSYYKVTQVCNLTAWQSDLWVLHPFYLDQLFFSYISCLSFPTGFRDKSNCMTVAEINKPMLRTPIIVPRSKSLDLLPLHIMNIFYWSSKCVSFFCRNIIHALFISNLKFQLLCSGTPFKAYLTEFCTVNIYT